MQYRDKYKASVREISEKNQAMQKLQDDVDKARKEVERAQEKLKNISAFATPASATDSDLLKQLEGYKVGHCAAVHRVPSMLTVC